MTLSQMLARFFDPKRRANVKPAPMKHTDDLGYNLYTYNRAGPGVANMTSIGTPGNMPIPNLPTSIPSHAADGADNHFVAYHPGVVEMSVIGLPSSVGTAQMPVTDPFASAPAAPANTAPNTLAGVIAHALVGGSLKPAPVQTNSTAVAAQNPNLPVAVAISTAKQKQVQNNAPDVVITQIPRNQAA